MSTSHKLSMLAGTTLVALLQVAAVAPAVAQNMDMKEVQAQIQALQKQIQDLQAQVNNAQATADDLKTTGGPSNKDHPGFIKLPGTDDTWLGVYGHIKADFIYDHRQSVGPQTDFSAIPMEGAPGTDRTGNLHFNAKQSTLTVETHTPTPYGDLSSYLDTDFYLSTQGNINISNSYALRLRNAYMSLGPVLVGQWWTTFLDVGAGPNTLDFNGPAGLVFLRQPQVRYTKTVKGEGNEVNQFMFAVENASPDFFSPSGLFNGNTTNIDQDGQTADPAGCTNGRVTPCQNGPSQLAKFPDLVARWENDNDYGHVSLQAMARKISVDTGVIGVPVDQVVRTSKFGYGVGFSGAFNMNTLSKPLGQDQVVWSFQGGPGIGRYLQDLLFNGAILNDNTHTLDLVTSMGGYVGYEHFWPGDEWESNLVLGWEKSNLKDVDQLIADGVQLTKKSESAHVNLIWHPVPNTSFGIETSWGRREVEGFIPVGQQSHGYMQRYQFTTQYNW